MASFKMTNGKEGADMCRHTSTGYECASNFPRSDNQYIRKAMFFVRHAVGDDGKPYTELGFADLDEADRLNGLRELKDALGKSGFEEVDELTDQSSAFAFVEHDTPELGSISVRMNSKSCSIKVVVDAIGDIVPEKSVKFIKEQEDVDDVLYHSLLSTLGPEMKQGPGGKDYAVKKARELAKEFLNGFKVDNSSSPVVYN